MYTENPENFIPIFQNKLTEAISEALPNNAVDCELTAYEMDENANFKLDIEVKIDGINLLYSNITVDDKQNININFDNNPLKERLGNG
jgi:hypothetical protein